MAEQDLIVSYRLRVITTGLIVSWFGLIVFGIWTFTVQEAETLASLVAVGGLLAALVILTFAPWRSFLASPLGDWLIVVWSVAAVLAVLLFEVRRSEQPNGIGLLLIAFFAAATLLPNRMLIGVGAIVSIAYVGAVLNAYGADAPSLAGLLLPFIGAIVFVLLLAVGIRTQLDEANEAYLALVEREADLTEKERELSQLYDVSRTIGAGSKLDEVLPELIGRVALSVNARIGLVLLYDPNEDRLNLMSPIWVAGHTVGADEFAVPLDEYGAAQRVFMSGDAEVINDTSVADDRDRLVRELDATRMAAVGLRIENRTVGVLVVADKADEFTSDDLGTLESVAAPAALVLNQMARYEQARSTGERMAELAQMKTDFVSVISHELRTPLTSIIGALSTLRRPELAPEDPRAVQLVEMAEKQSTRLKTMIEDLLVMSRIEADSLPVRPEQIDLDPFLVELIAALPGADRVDYNAPEGTPAVTADPDHLARVVTNLVDNSLKYGGDGRVEVDVDPADEYVQIAVVDHGPGIPYEQHDRIFERFTQLQPHATRSKGGAGLGLSIVRGLVEAMDGTVRYEPTVGGGATFIVEIPRA